jgi:hypothetical protein
MLMLIRALLAILLIPSLCFAGIECDGTDDYLSSASSFDFSSDGTVCMDVVFDDTSSDQIVMFIGIDNENGFGDGTSMEISFGDVSGQVKVSAYAFSSGDTAHVSASVSTATNYSLCFTWDDETANEIELFLDGTSQGTSALTDDFTADINDNLQLCAPSTLNRYADVKIYDLAIWDVVLTDREISLYSDSEIKGIARQIQPSSLGHYFTFDDVDGGSSADGVTYTDHGSENDGFLVNDGSNNTGATARSENRRTYP